MSSSRHATPTSQGSPRAMVCIGTQLLSSVVNELRAAGWRSTCVGDLPAGPWDLAPNRLLAVGDPSLGTDQAIELLARGVSVAAAPPDRHDAAALFDQCSRLVPTEWYDAASPPVTHGLDELQLRLLERLSEGDSVAVAATACHVSARTAARRLSAARLTLGARSTAEAVSRVRTRMCDLGACGDDPS